MITITYLTSRKEPMFDWFVDSLAWQFPDVPIQLVIVDYYYNDEMRLRDITKNAAQNLYDLPLSGVIHTAPKPTPWQGEFMQTKRPYFAAANARNTAACYATGETIAFVDDLTVLMPGWMNQILHAHEYKYVMCGAYKKVKNLQVENGLVISKEEFPDGIDSRWSMGSDAGIVPCSGGQLFGCSFALPLEYYLQVNGQDEIFDSLGGEDYSLGLNLEKAGYKLYYNRNALTLESEERHRDPGSSSGIRVDKKMGSTYSSNILLDKLMKSPKPISLGNKFSLRHLREQVIAGLGFPIPPPNARHWVDDQLLSEM